MNVFLPIFYISELDTLNRIMHYHNPQIQWQSELLQLLIDSCFLSFYSCGVCGVSLWTSLNTSIDIILLKQHMIRVNNDVCSTFRSQAPHTHTHTHTCPTHTQTQILENSLWPLCVSHLQPVKELCVSWHPHCGLSVRGDSPSALCFSWLI